MAFSNQSVYGNTYDEPYKVNIPGIDVNNTQYGLLQVPHPQFQYAMPESTGYGDSYMNTTLNQESNMAPPSSMMPQYMSDNTFSPEDYADEVDPMEPDYEQGAMDRTLESAKSNAPSFSMGKFGEGLMGLADNMRSQIGSEDYSYLSGSESGKGDSIYDIYDPNWMNR